MSTFDDDLTEFAARGARPLPAPAAQGYVEHDGAHIWYVTFGTGRPMILLHGGLGHSGNWRYRVPALMTTGYRPIIIDNRGHDRSTRDAQPYAYARMASDVRTVMNMLRIDCTSFIGWSDDTCVALTLAMQTPERAIGVFFFGCNMDPSGTKPLEPMPVIDRCFTCHRKDYTAFSPTPGGFGAFVAAITEMMQTQLGATAAELTTTRAPVTIAYSEHDEFIRPEHAYYLVRTIPGVRFVLLPGVSHFAPLQKPVLFNDAVLVFLHGLPSLQAAPRPMRYPQKQWVSLWITMRDRDTTQFAVLCCLHRQADATWGVAALPISMRT